MRSPFPFSPAVKALLIVNGSVFIAQLLPGLGQQLTYFAALVPVKVFIAGQLWRCVSYMFLHSTVNISHLLLNMLALWMFGGELEQRWGTKKFWGMYLLFGTGAGAFGALYLFDPVLRNVPVIGASGAIFGLLTAYAVYNPNRTVLLYFVLPVKAWIVAAAFAALSLLFSFSHVNGTAHLIHLGGIVIAFAYIKGEPLLVDFCASVRAMRAERAMRRRVGEQQARKRYYEEKVDPILDKISREGVEGLTEEDKKILQDIWKHKRPS